MESKEVYVKAHTRVIKQRAYRFVCKECKQVVERICYPSLPQYCERCRPPKSKSQKPATPKLVKSKKKLPLSVNEDVGVAVGE
ncbi:hypothetical protein H6G33_37225 [Calothrix sp. FACHB-1219]|uniref:hypothetical protein n=1 Tax=unclassified Calothrix TaxID=2619626 RepID=UPI001689EF27|nr:MULTISPECIES: hypothetical protein [unclassified Calothrix]MBD2208000.1 hypothetical protein [Calothrix sp. FACHB-168]MBD2222571.1 hypothetical protein [Calothrix sp. FACHB-1219]